MRGHGCMPVHQRDQRAQRGSHLRAHYLRHCHPRSHRRQRELHAQPRAPWARHYLRRLARDGLPLHPLVGRLLGHCQRVHSLQRDQPAQRGCHICAQHLFHRHRLRPGQRHSHLHAQPRHPRPGCKLHRHARCGLPLHQLVGRLRGHGCMPVHQRDRVAHRLGHLHAQHPLHRHPRCRQRHGHLRTQPRHPRAGRKLRRHARCGLPLHQLVRRLHGHRCMPAN